MTNASAFVEAQETYAALEAASITWDIERYDEVFDNWDHSDNSVTDEHHLRYIERKRAALVADYERLTGRKYPERGPQ